MKRLFRVWALVTVCLLGRVLGDHSLIKVSEPVITAHTWGTSPWSRVTGTSFYQRFYKYLQENPSFLDTFGAIIMPPAHPFLNQDMSVVVPGYPEGVIPDSRGYVLTAAQVGNNGYGTREELKLLLDYLNSQGKTCIADFTVRMMFGEQDPKDPSKFFGNIHGFTTDDFHQETNAQGEVVNTGATGPFEEYFRLLPGFPNLVHNSPRVFEVLLNYARELSEFGFKGLRIDYAKGVAPKFIAKILNRLYEEDPKQLFSFILPEYWTDLTYKNHKRAHHDVEYPPVHDQHHAIKAIIGWMKAFKKNLGEELSQKIFISAYDKPQFGMVRESIQTGEYSHYFDCPQCGDLDYRFGVNGLAGVIGTAMTGLGNHDTEKPSFIPERERDSDLGQRFAQETWPIVGRKGGQNSLVHYPLIDNQALKIIQGYAINLLTAPGVTHIFSQHLYDEAMEVGTDIHQLMGLVSPQIQKLIEIRKAYNITHLNKPERKIVQKGYLEVQPSDAPILVRMWADYKEMDIHEAKDRYDKLGFILKGIYANTRAQLLVDEIIPKNKP